MSQTIKKVVIAGGGTSGWCTAVALSRQFGTLLDITLIESAEIGTVGVGEATFPTICSFHKIHGIDEQEFLSATKGSIKLAISFENWARKGDRYIHPFGSFGNASWIGDFYHYWLAAKARGYDGELDDICFELQAAKSHKFAITENPKLNYAYHFDAALYAKFLRKLSEEKGVHRIEGKIVQVKQHLDNGFIESVVLESGVAIEGDLFIDCTGFRGLLIEETLNAGYETWGQWLRNDSAVALQTEFSGDIPPYTRAIAHDSGWQWKIPLQHRQGTGHVYSSAYISDEDARNTLLQNLDGDIRAELRLLKFNTGRRKQAWVKNCVAIGLAGGFVEPLESTSIHLIQIGVHRLLKLFPFEGCNEYLIRRYNELSRIEYENIRDFIILHYKATERDDTPYWRDCRDMAIPDSLAERLELFRATGYVHHNSDEVFGVTSWLKVMTGQRIVPQGYHHFPHVISDEKIFSGLTSMKEKIANAVKKMPSHTDFLEAYCTVK
ncbi:tryptophan halogenase family protein [Cellvibrio sp. PSBB023]|uniref:tryptophan halogenase family protein n=1 Tax=Cellvibrio sp. PSBB023 TaxID=1945512 RepID=UPI00098F4DB2|nr:tryptophan halogenase family protein [Cellvibrio sp. PSBB023]AQT60438.1 tryptophan halogenase [Cellvibrio sp. PSBB023]